MEMTNINFVSFDTKRVPFKPLSSKYVWFPIHKWISMISALIQLWDMRGRTTKAVCKMTNWGSPSSDQNRHVLLITIKYCKVEEQWITVEKVWRPRGTVRNECRLQPLKGMNKNGKTINLACQLSEHNNLVNPLARDCALLVQLITHIEDLPWKTL